MLATSRRRVNLNSERNDRAPGVRLQDIREVETCVQKKKVREGSYLLQFQTVVTLALCHYGRI